MEEPPITSKVVAYIVFGFVFTGFALILLFVISSNATNIADIPRGLEDYVVIQKFLNSNDCFAFRDMDTKRIYPGIVDIERFTQENLDKCYNAEQDGFRLSINELTIKSSNFESSKQALSKSILIIKGGKIENAGLKVEIDEQ